MLSVVHNIAMMNIDRQFGIITGKKSKSTEKLSSGYKVNRAADDAAGLSISEKMRRQIRGLSTGRESVGNGISWTQVGDGAMSELHDMIHRIRVLAVKASNGTLQDSDRQLIDAEVTQLKKEINSISKETLFNTKPVFDNSNVMLNIWGTPDDLNIFNATYDDVTGKVTYGGFVFQGMRISWDEVDPEMVKIDKDTGRQTFVGGNYSWYDADTGYSLNIICEDGAEVPEITRKIHIKADGSGISFDGKHYGWDKFLDEDGKNMAEAGYHQGAWGVDYEGAIVSVYFPDKVSGFDEMLDALNSMNAEMKYSLEQSYTGSAPEQAVNAEVKPNLRISNSLAAQLTDNHLKYKVRADENGIWLEDEKQNTIADSLKSWEDMGISEWNTGTDIQKTIVYSYSDDDGVNDTYLAFDFTLSDITSLDSVVDGLDGMVVSGNEIITNYATNLNVTLDENIVRATASAHNFVSFDEEKALGRDFDQQVVIDVADNNIEYDKNTHNIQLNFKDASGNAVVSFTGDSRAAEKDLEADLNTYLALVLRRKQQLALAGADPQGDLGKLGTASLTEMVGTGNITTSGYFDRVMTVDSNMKLSDGERVFKAGEVGKPYPTAFIDFSNFGTSFGLDDLVGLGFNSTCKTCDNHYSVVFSDGASGGLTAEGYQYSMRSQGINHTLFIDVNSMKAKVNTGADLADALVSIASECFDFHYTQYASSGSTLYIYDDRTQNSETRDATFDTAPYQAVNTDEISFQLKTDDNRNINLTYVYDFADIADGAIMQMKQDSNGDYVRKDDGTYIKYDANIHGGMDRYQIDVSYQKTDGTTAANLQDVVKDYTSHAVNKMLTDANVQLDARDYTKMKVYGDENPNVAIRSVFDTKVVENLYDNGITIRASSQNGDYVTIPRFPMNTVALNLFGANTRTYEAAQRTMELTDYALEVVSRGRSTYGAYQNRMEHLCNVNANTEENLTAAESRIRDTDIAQEMLQYSNLSIIQQAGQAMMSHAQQDRQFILSLLQ